MNSTSSFDAVLFDLDGVLTSTAAIRATASKRTFDAIRHFGEPLRLTPNAPLHRPATPTRQLPHAA